MKSGKAYIFIVAVLIAMFVVVFHYKMLEQHNAKFHTLISKEIGKAVSPKNSMTPMDSTLLLVVLSTIGILAGVLYNPKVIKLERKLDDYQKENRDQHTEIVNSIKYVKLKHELEYSLREIGSGIMEITSGELAKFIDFDENLFVDFATGVSNGPFDISALPAIRIRLREVKEASSKRAKLLGDDFSELHDASQAEHGERLIIGIEETLRDDVFNNKHKRFRMICEQFLHTHLTDSVRIYMDLKTKP